MSSSRFRRVNPTPHMPQKASTLSSPPATTGHSFTPSCRHDPRFFRTRFQDPQPTFSTPICFQPVDNLMPIAQPFPNDKKTSYPNLRLHHFLQRSSTFLHHI